MKQLPRIYCDMDGVLCDFKKHCEKATGVSIALNGQLYQRKMGTSKKTDIFGQLCLDDGGKQLWNFISMYRPHILSAYVEESFD